MNIHNFTYIITSSLMLLFLSCTYIENNDEVGCYEVDDFQINIIASIQPWDLESLEPALDEQNYFGISSDASDDYDSFDIPEPPTGGCSNCINAYFSHAEWDSSFGDNFTQEFQSNLFCDTKEWNLSVKATCGGSSYLSFSYDSIPSNITIELFYDNLNSVITNGSIIEFTLSPNMPKDFLIKINVN